MEEVCGTETVSETEQTSLFRTLKKFTNSFGRSVLSSKGFFFGVNLLNISLSLVSNEDWYCILYYLLNKDMKSNDQILLEDAYARTYGIRKVKDSEVEQMIEDIKVLQSKVGEMHHLQLKELKQHLEEAIAHINSRLQ